MQCAYCKEVIIDGATLCRFCGRDQPPSFRERRRRAETRRNLLIAGATIGFVILFVVGCLSHQADHDRLERAAACGGITYDQLEEAAQNAAQKSGMSLSDAEQSAAILACPRLSK
jgi:hypothetical protein